MPEVTNADFWRGREPYEMPGIGVKIENLVLEQDYPGYIIKFAEQLIKRRYVHPKEFFLYLTKYESKELVESGLYALEWFKRTDPNWQLYGKHARNMTVAAMLLAKAEGESILNSTEQNICTICLLNLVIIHAAHLDGTIIAHYDNFTVLNSNKNFFDIIKKDDKKDDKTPKSPD